MKEVGICTDTEALAMLGEHYDNNSSDFILEELDGDCFRKHLDRVNPTE